MVTTARTAVRVDRLRSLNLPRPVAVETDRTGMPRLVMELVNQSRTLPSSNHAEPSWMTVDETNRKSIEVVGEIWRVDDEWWRKPIARRYVEVVLEGGGHAMLYEDLTTGTWFQQCV